VAGIAGATTPPEAGAGERSPWDGLSFAVRPSHVRTLLWLRWRITLRGYTRSWQRVVSLIFSLLFIVLVGGGLAVATAAGYQSLPRLAAAQILFGVLGLLYVLWAVLPLLQYNLNEGLDVTKLQAYPITRGEQMASLVLATLLDVSTLFIVALFAAIMVSWNATPAATVITVLALLLAFVHIVGFSQLVLAALMGLLRSRRYRDLMIVVFAVLGTSCWLIEQFVFSRLNLVLRGADISTLEHLQVDRYAQWLPTGMAARAITLADQGQYLLAVAWLLLLAVLVPALLILWALVLNRSLASAETAGGTTRRRVRRASAAPVPAPATTVTAVPVRRVHVRAISGPALAIAGKDAKYLWRDPQLKAALLSALAPIALVLLPNLYSSSSDHPARQLAASGMGVLFAPLPALLIVLVISLNAFGMERQGLQTLFLFPVKPLDIFWGKNLVTGVLTLTVEIALILVKAALSGGWSYVLPAAVAGAAAVLTLLGLTNVTSVVAPFRARTMRMGDASSFSSEGGCLRSVISVVAMVIAVLLLAPVGLAVALPPLLSHPSLYAVTLPFSLMYGMLLYQVPTRLVARVLLRRAPEILAVTVREA
jgi:ABC-2 type transport system permease protein